MKVIIVMPAYNAAKTIVPTLERIDKKVLDKVHEIIVVNDGSKDDTQKMIEKVQKKFKIKLIVHPQNKGYGAAQKTGFTQAMKDGADIAVLLHSDGQYPPEMIPQVIAPIESGKADVVIGSRILGKGALKGGMPLHKYIGNRTLTFIENIAYGMNISEYHSGYMIYSKKALSTIPFTKLSDILS